MKNFEQTQGANFMIVSIKEPSGVTTFYGSTIAVQTEINDLRSQVRVRTLSQTPYETKEKMLMDVKKCKGEVLNADHFNGYQQQLA